jgi:hypothetical protein
MQKGIIALVIVIVVGGGVYWFMNMEKPMDQAAAPTDTSNAMRIEENMIIVNEQKPGNSVTIAQVHLAAPGFVVIHEDKDGAAGEILGSSTLLPSGDSGQIVVSLSKSLSDATKLHAMLHNDTNGDGKFDSSVDMPVPSQLGGPIDGLFEISAQASEQAPISI